MDANFRCCRPSHHRERSQPPERGHPLTNSFDSGGIEVIGALFAGVLTTDRGASYEARTLRSVRMQKCLAHLIRNVSDALALLASEDAEKAEAIRQLMREALALWHKHRAGQAEGFEEKSRALIDRADTLLEPVTLLNPILDRIVNGIGRQHDRGNLLRFLTDTEIQPTNNYAERMLRPAVIARKVSQCSRTDAGAQAHAAWCSVIATLRALGSSNLLEDLQACLRTGCLPQQESLALG